MGFRDNTRSRGFGGSRSGSRGGFGGRDRGGFGGRREGGFGEERGRSRDSGRPQMHDVICDKCGKECQVPFKPSGDKPVLCSDCFRKAGDSGSRSFSSRGGSSNSGISQEQFNQLNAKLDKIIEFLESVELEEDDGEDLENDGSDEETVDGKEDSENKETEESLGKNEETEAVA